MNAVRHRYTQTNTHRETQTVHAATRLTWAGERLGSSANGRRAAEVSPDRFLSNLAKHGGGSRENSAENSERKGENGHTRNNAEFKKKKRRSSSRAQGRAGACSSPGALVVTTKESPCCTYLLHIYVPNACNSSRWQQFVNNVILFSRPKKRQHAI